MENIVQLLGSMFKGRSLMNSTMHDFSVMMRQLSEMYDSVAKVLFGGAPAARVRKKLYSEDIFVNKSERNIRKKVMEHLAFGGKCDIGSSMILISVAKDAERIGDYCKNLYEVTQLFKKFGRTHKYFPKLKAMSDEVSRLIRRTEKTFRKSMEADAEDIMDRAHRIGVDCDALLEELAGSRLGANDAVCLALVSRHIKRVSSHLANIASSVVLPVHKIDFVSRRKKGKSD